MTDRRQRHEFELMLVGDFEDEISPLAFPASPVLAAPAE